jgi:glucose-6-phosphate dehydrogenase assembly protein OpcA
MTTGGVVRAGHASGLHAVTRELAELRTALLRTGEETRGVRLSVLTLVVACTDTESGDRAAEAVQGLAANHPTRAIVVVADPRAASAIEADLSLTCSRTGGEQVCVELVRLSVGGESARHLRSVVSPLLLPDVPVHLWLAGAPPLGQALRPDSLELCERLILDTDAYPDPGAALSALADAVGAVRHMPAVGDLAWSRTRSWREQIGRAFDTADLRGFARGVESAEIRSTGSAPRAEARLLAGWLSSRLRRPGQEGPRIALAATEDGDGAGTLRSVVVRAVTRDRRARVEVGDDGSRLTTTVVVEGGLRSSSATWILPAEHPGLVDLVGAQLEEQGVDPVHTAALLAAPGAERP